MLICVIGAGIAGISAIKSCLEDGLEVVCYERCSSIGGLWSYRENDHKYGNLIIDDTTTNTSKEVTCYSDFPMPSDFPNYLPHRKMIQYLKLYCEHFQLESHVKFNHEVLEITEAEDYSTKGSWVVSVKDLTTGKQSDRVFDGIMICNGVLRVPFIPKQHKGGETFSGDIIHSLNYQNNSGYRNKNVLVVGSGNTAGDIAVDVSSTAKQTYLSSRNGLQLISRISTGGRPLDIMQTSRCSFLLLNSFPFIGSYFLNRYINSMIDHTFYGISNQKSALLVQPLINDVLASRLLSGKIIFKGPVHQIIPRGVHFQDEYTLTEIDTIVYGTGYTEEVKFIPKNLTTDIDGHLQLYKAIFPPNLKHSTLAFVGYFRLRGPVPIISETQSRWIVQVFQGKCKLPANGDAKQPNLHFKSVLSSTLVMVQLSLVYSRIASTIAFINISLVLILMPFALHVDSSFARALVPLPILALISFSDFPSFVTIAPVFFHLQRYQVVPLQCSTLLFPHTNLHTIISGCFRVFLSILIDLLYSL